MGPTTVCSNDSEARSQNAHHGCCGYLKTSQRERWIEGVANTLVFSIQTPVSLLFCTGTLARLHKTIDDDPTEARRVLTEGFATFDAGKAQCFLAKDREHLLAVIEASFGDFYDFNRVARNLFASRLHDHEAPAARWALARDTRRI